MSIVFKDILQNQIKFKNEYKRCDTLLHDIIIIQIRDNQIIKVIDGKGWIHPTRKKQYICFIQNIIKKHVIKNGNININLSDHPKKGCLNFCRIKSSNYFLIPDFRFTLNDINIDKHYYPDKFSNYDEQVLYMKKIQKDHKFEDKINKFYTNCIPHISKVNYFKYALNNKDICTGYVFGGSVHKYLNLPQNFVNVLKLNDMAGEDFKYFNEHFKYKYVIYNDGNTLSERTKLLLNVNPVIIKKVSPYEEFYSYLLKDNIDYIEYNDESELRDIHKKLENDEKFCLKLIDNNNKFTNNILTYNNILEYTAYLLNSIL